MGILALFNTNYRISSKEPKRLNVNFLSLGFILYSALLIVPFSF